MLRKLIFPLVLGLAGVAVLVALGVWQMQRLAWKEDVLAGIDARLMAPPADLPATPNEARDEYTAVQFGGAVAGDELHVLVSGTSAGTGYLAIAAFETETGRRVLLDLGLLPLEAKDAARETDQTTVLGNLIWPDDVNSSTPEPDLAANIWFGRDVVAMAEALDTEPLMVVAREMSTPDARTTLLPVDTSGIKNDHLEYAITWFSLALVWAAMTAYLITRTLRQKDS